MKLNRLIPLFFLLFSIISAYLDLPSDPITIQTPYIEPSISQTITLDSYTYIKGGKGH